MFSYTGEISNNHTLIEVENRARSEHLPSKHKVLSSNPSTAKKKKKERERE
jgi:hypothetical protein